MMTDTFFLGSGKVTTDFGSSWDVGYSVSLQPDGKILVGGYTQWPDANIDFSLARYNADGSLDTTFGGDGKVTTAIGLERDCCFSVTLQADGKILAAGFSDGPTDELVSLVRYNADGSLDTTFGGDGKVTTDVGTGPDRGYSVTLQLDGKILVGGSRWNGSNRDFSLLRYNADGSLDTSFGGDGKVTTVGTDSISSVVLQPDGKTLVAGADFSLARYNADGSLDTTFDGDGKTGATSLGGLGVANSAILQPDGKILVGGYVDHDLNNSNIEFALVRYNADGSLDTTFGGDGKVTTDVGTGPDRGYSVTLQLDGKILVAGQSGFGGDAHFALVRYNADGSLDTTFDGDGKVSTKVGLSSDEGLDVILQPDGKILVVGTSGTGADSHIDFTLVRYNADGSLDTTFGGVPPNDHAPVITTAPTQTVAESTTFVAALTSTDVDVAGINPAIFTINGGSDAALFDIAEGNLVFKAAPDYETDPHSYQVEVSAFDGLNTTAKTITVNVTDLNDNAPVITSAATQTVAENVKIVAALTSTDADTVGSFSDNFNSGASSAWGNELGAWTVNGGVYSAVNPSVYPNAHSLVSGMTWSDFSVDVLVDNPADGSNRAGGIWLRASNDTTATGVGVSGVLFAWAHSPLDTYWHVVLPGQDGYGYWPNLVPFETAPEPFAVHIEVKGDTYQAFVNGQLVTSLVDNHFTSGMVGLFDGNLVSQQTFDNFSVTGVAADGTSPPVTFSITGGADAALFEVVTALDGSQSLQFLSAPDYEIEPHEYQVEVSAFDGLNTTAKTITVTLIDVNEAPTAVTLTNTLTLIAENTSTANHIKVADINVTDDVLGTNTLGLIGSDSAFFEIVGSELFLKAGTVINFESKSTYAVAVTVDDLTVGTTPDATSATYTLNVSNVSDTPLEMFHDLLSQLASAIPTLGPIIDQHGQLIDMIFTRLDGVSSFAGHSSLEALELVTENLKAFGIITTGTWNEGNADYRQNPFPSLGVNLPDPPLHSSEWLWQL